MNPSPLEIAVRAFTRPSDMGPARPHREASEDLRHPRWVLVIDTETATDPSQRLLFGSYRIIDVVWDGETPHVRCAEEGLFHEDVLPERDPTGYEVLGRYVTSHAPAVDLAVPDASPILHLRTLSRFMDEVWRPLVCEAQAMLVCFNLPFDVSRLAQHVGPAGPHRRSALDRALGGPVKRSAFEGGWSFSFWGRLRPDGGWSDLPARQRVLIKHLDSKRALKGLGSAAGRYTDPQDLVYEDGGGTPFRGHLLDLRTLVFALTDRGHTLESACDEFDVHYAKRKVIHGVITPEYVDYNREDVGATVDLWGAVMAEYLRHPIHLQATKAYSPASVGKAYLRAMNVPPPMERLGNVPTDLSWDQLLGCAMVSYYGGRAECRIRGAEVPVVLLDFTSMYPTLQTLLGLERLLTCERIDMVDMVDGSVRELRKWLRTLGADALFRPETWRRLGAICLVRPRQGDILPIRARYGGKGSPLGIGVNVWGDSPPEPLWYTLPDVVASYLLSGQIPEVLRVLKVRPRGRNHSLRPVMVRGAFEADLRTGHFFARIVEGRAVLPKPEQKTGLGLFLKVLANSTSYGIFAEMDRREVAGKRKEKVQVHGLSSFEFETQAPEAPGEFFFAPTAALVTGAARLMLALLEHEVVEAGGTYAFADTDSMAVLAKRRGGRLDLEGTGNDGTAYRQSVRALSWAQ